MGILDSLMDWAGNIDGGDVAKVLGAGGQIATAFGEGKNSQQVSSVPWGAGMNQGAKAQLEALLPRIQAYGNKGYQGIPRRALNAEDYDPVFGSKARQQLYGYYNPPQSAAQPQQMTQEQQAMQSATQQGAPQAAMVQSILSQLGNTGNSFLDSPGMRQRLESILGKDGSTNEFNGETVNVEELLSALPVAAQGGRGLMGIQQASGSLESEQQKQAKQALSRNMYAAEYDPRDDFLSQLLTAVKPLLVGAVLGPGIGAALGGAGVGATAANLGSKALTSIVNRGVR
jgi:hypothetical protein